MPTAMPVEPLTSRLGNLPGRTVGSISALVVVGLEVDGVEVRGRPAAPSPAAVMRASVYRMAAGGSPAMRAEVALPVDQRVAHVPVLGHADERRVDDRFAVRVVVAAGVAGDLGALDGACGRGAEVQVVHRDQDAPLRRLEPVADVGQRPVHDRAHRVGEVAVLQLLLDLQVFDPVGGGGVVSAMVFLQHCGREACRPGKLLTLGRLARNLLPINERRAFFRVRNSTFATPGKLPRRRPHFIGKPPPFRPSPRGNSQDLGPAGRRMGHRMCSNTTAGIAWAYAKRGTEWRGMAHF